MFKKHKYKFLAVLILFVVVGGGAVYYFKKKEATKKIAATKEEEEPAKKPVEQPKEPITTTEVEKSKGANPVKKDLVLTKGAAERTKAK